MGTVGNRTRVNTTISAKEETVQRLAKAPVANIGDVMQRLYSFDAGLVPLNSHRLCGPAFTIRVPTGDNLYLHHAMDMLSTGEVLVVAAEGSSRRAITGELMLQYMATKNIGGVVVDGYVRDLDYIKTTCPYPVYARGTNPNGPYKNGPGEINYPVAIGGVVVNPGDIIVGDVDGLAVVPVAEAEAVANEVEAVMAKEASIIENITTKSEFNRPWVAEQMSRIGAVHI
ncbi:methyltransferase [Citricoccus muralis]|uniref:Putative 4-hydroxy-4-methyl-2-oxoglutarate aldolase n=2 Tax=Citricoccus muralis TaxID=169134 RepID=A0ABY8HBJ3_9MICC|nr:methyltransferase [Citricoccus muralis]WFP17973.1 methyltransferase [Citricoccus muralis]